MEREREKKNRKGQFPILENCNSLTPASSPCGRHGRTPKPPLPPPPSLSPASRRHRSWPPEVRAGCEDGGGGAASSPSLRSCGHDRYNGRKEPPARTTAMPATGSGPCAAILGGHGAGSTGYWTRGVWSLAVQLPWRLAGADGALQPWHPRGLGSGAAPTGSGERAASSRGCAGRHRGLVATWAVGWRGVGAAAVPRAG